MFVCKSDKPKIKISQNNTDKIINTLRALIDSLNIFKKPIIEEQALLRNKEIKQLKAELKFELRAIFYTQKSKLRAYFFSSNGFI